ncbi:HPr family phosphocarrier protein [Radiobacillus kanasensis]|uniref:HPr family phosphocarrier protein n=1 Tax=Radiobacillus kanasensis TaxID=2844358 RepID=UPI001E60020E|nr:HPr family phosphocarrier protein [Radiobacillus kanasensis]UFT98497.1 HPr family phosphocarrier protein [Radiobacillus kanasensis]
MEKTVQVSIEPGLQARPAAQFVQLANRFSSDIFIEKDEKQVNVKSIMGLMSLAIAYGEEITFIIEGPDETEAMEELVSFVEGKRE